MEVKRFHMYKIKQKKATKLKSELKTLLSCIICANKKWY